MPIPNNNPSAPYTSRWIWLTYLLLFAIAIPWYFPAGDTTLWFGLPAWLVAALGGSLALSIFTAILMLQPWPEEQSSEEESS